MVEYSVLHLFCGIGGAALGMQQAVEEYRGQVGRFHTLAGIDNDPEACADFEAITGAPAVEMDLFSRQQYTDFHGHEPPADWREADQYDLLRATDGVHPDVIFTSPPCKGLSGLLPEASAKSRKYQALNRLVVRGFELALSAYQDDLPAVILLENVPRITSRGAGLLREVKGLLGRHGYEFAEGYHDCGEIGGLGQRRKRFLLIARNRQKMNNFIYQPPARKLRSIGDIIGPLPMPDDPALGPMHRLPRLQWKTWVRLALIPAGGDWRDLEDLGHNPRGGAWAVVPWEQTGGTVTGSARVGGSNGMAALADPRLGFTFTKTHQPIYQVRRWDEPGATVTGAIRPNNGALSVADPRLNIKPRSGTFGVQAWDEPGKTVIGAGDIHAGAAAVADPRIPADNERPDPPPVIIAEDGTWHRPLTTLELAALQGFPVWANGKPLKLAGSSDARWRERIGNAVPPPAARAMGEQILTALMVAARQEWVLGATPIWVVPGRQQEIRVGG